jgi:hypothetical protein
MIGDTPAEAEPSYACEIGRDTCPSPGDDPVQNYMDYSEDNCLSQFTTQQRRRMIAQWNMYRASGNSTSRSVPSTANRTVTIKVGTDEFPGETGWTLERGSTLLYTQAAGTYREAGLMYSHTFNNLSPGEYTFLILDYGWDGLCCEAGFGGFEITAGTKVLASGASFKGSMLRKFKIV